MPKLIIHYFVCALAAIVVILSICFAIVGVYGILTGNSSGWLVFLFFGTAAVFLLSEFWSQRRSRKERLGGMSEEEFKDFKEREDRKEKITVELVEEFVIQSRKGEPIPPWLKFPGPCPFHIFWRMGHGESYISEEFGPFMIGLSINERQDYFHRYDLGENWPDRSFWYDAWIEWEDDY